MKSKLTCLLLGGFVLSFSVICIFFPGKAFSESERRVLAEFPKLSAKTVLSGDFSSKFEEYATDRFPFRDMFRSIKAYSSNFLFNKADNNEVIYEEGHLSKLDYPLNPRLLDIAVKKFSFLYESFIKDTGCNVYLSIVPDKNYFLDTLKFDYTQLTDIMRKGMEYAEYIDLFPYLSLSDYYTTDSHWKQERIADVAKALSAAMNVKIDAKYTVNKLESPFYGVYSGQSALKTKPDTIKYLTNDILNGCVVHDYNTGTKKPSYMYDMEKAVSRDPYEIFLSGNSPLITIENPAQTEKRGLVIFRDSFASSLAPLLVPGYSKISLVDIRYMQSGAVGSFINFEEYDDVLFLYSSSLLNAASAFK